MVCVKCETLLRDPVNEVLVAIGNYKRVNESKSTARVVEVGTEKKKSVSGLSTDGSSSDIGSGAGSLQNQ